MAIGPVQLVVLGFEHPDFKGEIIEELEKLHESGTVRVIDSLVVYKDAEGKLEVEHLSNYSPLPIPDVDLFGEALRPLVIQSHDVAASHTAECRAEGEGARRPGPFTVNSLGPRTI